MATNLAGDEDGVLCVGRAGAGEQDGVAAEVPDLLDEAAAGLGLSQFDRRGELVLVRPASPRHSKSGHQLIQTPRLVS